MSPPKAIHPQVVAAGSLARDFIIPASRIPRLDSLGGPAAYAAAALALWDLTVGILSRVGPDFPARWLNDLREKGIDPRGIRLEQAVPPLCRFYAYDEEGRLQPGSPVRHFAALETPLPPALHGYVSETDPVDDLRTRRPTSPLFPDIPPDYRDAQAAHLCPMDFISHSVLQTALRTGSLRTITLEADPAYLLPQFWPSLPDILTGLACLVVAEDPLRVLFRGRRNELAGMAADLGAMRCEHILIRLSDGGHLLYQHSTRQRWHFPAYPIQAVNRHSARHALGGGFLGGYLATFDPVEAALHGIVSELVASECLHPLSMLDPLPGLVPARLQVLRSKVKLLDPKENW